MIWTRLASSRRRYDPAALIPPLLSTQGDRHGQRRAKGQSGDQETQEGKDQGDCRCTEPEGRRRWLAADLGFRQEEIMLDVSWPRRSSFSVPRSHGLPGPAG